MRVVDSVVVPTSDRRVPIDMARHVGFFILVLGSVAWFWAPLATVVNLSLQPGEYEHYSHIVAIPFMSLFLTYIARREIFAEVGMALRPGALVITAGIAASWLPRIFGFDQENTWSLAIVSLVTTCVGAFILCYGTAAFRKATFPLLLLVLMAPLPPVVLHPIVVFLQHASAEATAVIFDLLGVPLFRQGILFSLPGLNIKIAEECSGIRSSLALFIMSLLAGQLFLRRAWSKTTLAVIVIPLAIVKNAVRIVVLSLLAIHVDPSFITGGVTHRYSGIPLFAVSFAMVGGIVWVLQRLETRLADRATRVAG